MIWMMREGYLLAKGGLKEKKKIARIVEGTRDKITEVGELRPWLLS